MKVQELIEELEGQDPDTEVKFCYNYGDHWHTEVAQDVETVETGVTIHSDYHGMDKVVDDKEDLKKKGSTTCVLLRYAFYSGRTSSSKTKEKTCK